MSTHKILILSLASFLVVVSSASAEQQVAVEARVIEVDSNLGQELGIDANSTDGSIGTAGDFRGIDAASGIRVTPQISNDGLNVMLDAFGDDANVLSQPRVVTQTREPATVFVPDNVPELTTDVTVRDGQTVVLGGLIRDDIQDTEDRVPVLGDVPVVNRLFRGEGENANNRNLDVIVTPTIVDPAQE